MPNLMVACVQCHTIVSKQIKSLDGNDVGPPKWRICGRGLNRSVHEGIDDTSNEMVHFKTCSGKVNI